MQQNPRKKVVRERPKLGADVAAAKTHRRREASDKYALALKDLMSKVREETENIAVEHSKSIRKVSNNIHMSNAISLGKHSKISSWNAHLWMAREMEKENGTSSTIGNQVLPELAKTRIEMYKKLTDEEKAEAVKWYMQHKANVAKGCRITGRSRAKDVVSTITAVGAILDNLHFCAGVETQLFVACGLTDLPLNSISYATPGVENFMQSTLKLDPSEYVGKMEGYALQGSKLRGAANHNDRCCALRAQVREIINTCLREVTGIPEAKMEWKLYFRNVVKRYNTIIEGWPSGVEFVNLSDTSSSMDTLEMLLRSWKQGMTHWKMLTQAEVEALEDERNAQIEGGELQPPAPQRTHSDKGKKRKRHLVFEESESNAENTRAHAQSEGDDDEASSARHCR